MLLALWYHGILAFFFAVVAILLIMVILLQRGKGVGLAGAFGGTGGSAAFGAKTGDFLTWVTVVGAAVLLLFTILLNYIFVPAPPVLTPTPPPGGTTPGDQTGMLWQPTEAAEPPAFAGLAVFGEAEF